MLNNFLFLALAFLPNYNTKPQNQTCESKVNLMNLLFVKYKEYKILNNNRLFTSLEIETSCG